jgi:molybdenum cofactor cytidylyltransferase
MICAIILAAGQSRRMGAQKLLLPFDGRTVIGRVAGEILRSPVARTLVVVGADGARIAAALENEPVSRKGAQMQRDREPCESSRESPRGSFSFVTNPDPSGDMLSSVRCGLRALPPDCEAILVAIGDQPSITADLVARMVHVSHTFGRGIIIPVYRGKRGHPLLFSARYSQEVLTRYDDLGLRGLLHAHPEDVLELPADSASVLSDMDYPQDYLRELDELAGRDFKPQ